MSETTEGWGGDARKIHYVRDGRGICGKTDPFFKPILPDCYGPEDLARHPDYYCKLCLRIWRKTPGAVEATRS